MNLSTVFNDMQAASKNLYNAIVDYQQSKKNLAKRLSDNVDLSSKDEKLIRGQLDNFRRTASGAYIKEEKSRIEQKKSSSLSEAKQQFRTASENLREAIEAIQPVFNVNDSLLQNSLNVAKIGNNLSETAARKVLSSLRTNKTNFDIVKSAMIKAGVNPEYIKGIYPFDGDSLQFAYDMAVSDIVNNSSDQAVIIDISDLDKKLIKDSAAFGVNMFLQSLVCIIPAPVFQHF